MLRPLCWCVNMANLHWPDSSAWGSAKKIAAVLFLKLKQNFCRRSIHIIPRLSINNLESFSVILGSAEESYIYMYIYFNVFENKGFNQYPEIIIYIHIKQTHQIKVYRGLLLQKELIMWRGYMLRTSYLLFCGSSTLNAYIWLKRCQNFKNLFTQQYSKGFTQSSNFMCLIFQRACIYIFIFPPLS